MERSRPHAAVREVVAVLQFVSPLPQRGGDVCLLLALACEGIEKGERARALYDKFRYFLYLARCNPMCKSSTYDTVLRYRDVAELWLWLAGG
jgi:hypothetical protein